VQGFDPPLGPARHPTANVIPDRIRNPEQAEPLAEPARKKLMRKPLIIAEGVMHTDDGELRRPARYVDGLEPVCDDKPEIPISHDLAQAPHRIQFQPAHVLAVIVEEDDLV